MTQLFLLLSFVLILLNCTIVDVCAIDSNQDDLPVSRELKNGLLNQQPRLRYGVTGGDFPVFARLVDTLSFAKHLERCHLCLVAFFEPNSQSFLETKFELDLAAKVLRRISLKTNGLGLLLVDATKDPYLQHVYAKEMRYSWQAKKDFGLDNKQTISFYPTIIKLFKNGQMVEEYTGPIEMESIVHFVTLRAFEGFVTIVNNSNQWKAELDYPAIVFCGDNNVEEEDVILKEYSSQAFFYRIHSNEFCQELILGDGNSNNKEGIYYLMPNSEPRMIQFPKQERMRKKLLAMTPDNSWKFILEPTEYLVIHLIGYPASDYPLKQYSTERKDLQIQENLLEAIEEFEKEFLLLKTNNNNNKIQYVQVDGRIFGEEFNIKDFPSLVIHKIHGRDRRPRVMNLLNSSSTSKKEIGLFLKEYFQSIAVDLNHNNSIIEKENDKKQEADPTTITGLYFRIHTLLRRAMLIDSDESSSTTTTTTTTMEFSKGIFDILKLDLVLGENVYLDFLKQIWFSGELGKTIKNPQKLMELKFAIDRLQGFQSELPRLEGMSNSFSNSNLVLSMNQTLTKLKEFIQSKQQQQQKSTTIIKKQKYQEIDRIHESNLTLKEFLVKYSKLKRPILISGLNPFKKGFEWTIERIKDVCGSLVPTYTMRERNSSLWGELVSQKDNSLIQNMTLGEFISHLSKNAPAAASNMNANNVSEDSSTSQCEQQQEDGDSNLHSKLYVHDFSVPVFCPNLLGPPPFDLFKLPRFIAGDLLQRIPFNSFAHSWPSLFVGGKETSSGLHVDAGGTSFVMFLMEGRKLWTVFHPIHIGRLGLDPSSEKFTRVTDDMLFEQESVDDFESSDSFPIFRGVQYPGEMMFIPGNCPHAVKNFDVINLGWSMNIVDIGNKMEHLRDLLMTNNFKEFDSFVDPKRKLGMTSKMRDLTFGEFKSYRWEEIFLDLND